ncbi:MAG TPA: SDR family oxidoreductase [Flexivirga sp.]|uniref:SDR family oxidoreductase n=1 Tax=Flexivirga sp. TaxID=1962927 RepID=UPI002B7609E9|nr:SDR family oxidoreductase [Flexivirga sp.]HWC22267.1 SDR family oxidoreductase [Flexivirga sp.]
MKIVVAGATGTLGRHVVDAVRAAGHEPVAVSRESGVDLTTGAGLTDVLHGAGSVIDASATSSTSTKASVQFFETVTRNLLAAEQAIGVTHHVAVSIIGAAEVNSNYYAGKAAQEQILLALPSGWSMLRTTQFHEFTEQLVHHGKVGPIQVVPRMRSQPIAAAEVAAEIVGLAVGEPRGLVQDLAGPREENMADLVRRLLDGSGRVVEVPLPGAWGRAMRNGSLLPQPGTRLGTQTYDEWLATRAR